MMGFWHFLLLFLCCIAYTQSILPPTADQQTEDAQIGEKFVVYPDPNECRSISGTYCCNRIYYKSVYTRDIARWDRYQDELAIYYNRKRLYPARDPGLPPQQPTPIRWDNFNIFEAEVDEGAKTQRVLPQQEAHPTYDAPWFDTFYISCWLTLPNEVYYSLWLTSPRKQRALITDNAHRSRKFRVQCDVNEVADYFSNPPRRQWARSNPSEYPEGNLQDARCIQISSDDWRRRQKEFEATKVRRRNETNKRMRAMNGAAAHATNFARKSRAKLVSQNAKVVQPGSVETCLQFPTLSGDNRWSSGIPNQVPANDAADQFAEIVDQHSIAFVARTTTAASVSDSNDHFLGSDEASHQRTVAAQQYADSIEASSLDAEWDYPELYANRDWDYPELYAEATNDVAPVQSMDVRLVSRSTEQMQYSVQTVVDRAVGPSSFLSISDTGSSNGREGRSVEFDQTLQRLQDEPVDTILEACVTTMPQAYGYEYDLPVTLWTDVLALPGPGNI